jgi:hypothetical protein
MQSLAPTFDAALIRKLPQHALERGTVGIFMLKAAQSRVPILPGRPLMKATSSSLDEEGLLGEAFMARAKKALSVKSSRSVPAA